MKSTLGTRVGQKAPADDEEHPFVRIRVPVKRPAFALIFILVSVLSDAQDQNEVLRENTGAAAPATFGTSSCPCGP